jgi:tetratricopeptide (TPR) repeat protein
VPYTSEIEKLEQRYNENPKGRNFAPLADAYRKAKELDLAIELCRKGLELHPDYISAYIVYGRCLLDKKDDPAAEQVFRKVLTFDPENVLALRLLAEIADRTNRVDQAIEWLGKLLAVDPMNGDASEALARAKGKMAALAGKPTVPLTQAAEPTAPQLALLDLEPTALSDAPTKRISKPDFELERASAAHVGPLAAAPPPGDLEVFDGTLNVDPSAHAAAKAEGLEVEEDIELQQDVTQLEGLARTQYEGSGMFKLESAPAAEEEMPHVDLPLIMPDDVDAAPALQPPPPPPPPPPAPKAAAPPPRSAPAMPAAVALADDDGAADVAALSRAEPVVTETMAELYLKQGHREEALGVYQALLARRPGDARLAAKVAGLSRPAQQWTGGGRGGAGGVGGGGQTVGAFLKGILAGRAASAAPVEPSAIGSSLDLAFSGDETPPGEGEAPGTPTRPAQDDISLDTVFGDAPRDSAPPPAAPVEAAPSGAPGAPTAPTPSPSATGGFSFDQFFGATGQPAPAAPPPSSGAAPRASGPKAGIAPEEEKDLDQFQSWLKGLKS